MRTVELLKQGFIGSPPADSNVWDWVCPTCGESHIQLWQARMNGYIGRRRLMYHERQQVELLDFPTPSAQLSRGEFEYQALKLHIDGVTSANRWRETLGQLVR